VARVGSGLVRRGKSLELEDRVNELKITITFIKDLPLV
jgi:hypothetical protein